jgi:RimJ/RimL family protein N-acetyltransferase
MTVFETARLVIRDWTEHPDDLACAYDIYRRPEVVRWLGGAGLPLTAPGQAVDLVRRWQARNAAMGEPYGLWAVVPRDPGVPVGTVLMKPMPGRDEGRLSDDIEVGWHLHPDAWGRGYATEAARGALARGFDAGVDVIHAVVSPGNAASIAVTRRLGMTPVGRRTDWYGGEELETFVLTAEQHRPGDGHGVR